MLREERLLTIIETVNKRKYVSLHELMQLTSSSESTIRGDLVALEKGNKIIKLHGGAQSIDAGSGRYELDIDEKSSIEVEAKKMIAKYAASKIQDNSLIYIDAGTTTGFIIDYMLAKNVVVVTNSTTIGKKATANGYKVYVTGGEIKLTTDAFVGAFAAELINKFNFDLGFFGSNGIDLNAGLTTPDYAEAFIKESAIKKCRHNYALIDSTKFDVIAAVKFASIEDVTVITNKVPDKYHLDNIKEAC